MKHDYSKALAICAIWMAVAFTAFFSPAEVGNVAGYAVGGTALSAFFL